MLRVTLARILHDRRRLALTVSAIAVGITFLTAALVLSGSTRAAFDASYEQVYAGIDVLVRGPEALSDGGNDDGAPLDADTLDAVAGATDVASAEGRRRTVAHLLDDGDGHTAIAMSVPLDPAAAAIEVRAGRLPSGDGEVSLDAALAEQAGIAVGDRADVLLPSGPRDVEVVGTVGFGRLDGLAGGGRVLVDRDVAASFLGVDGYADIAVRAAPGTEAAALAERLSQQLGDGVRVVTADQAASRDAAAAAQQTAALRWILTGVAILALVVGGFVIANTFRVLVAQRARELALLRGVGATRRQVASSIRLEAALTGAAGALLGVALGVLVGAVLVTASAGLLPGLPPTSATVSVWSLVAGPVVGVVLASLAAHGAARRVLAVPPVAALRAVALEDARPSRLRLVLGAVLVTGGSGTTLLGLGTGGGIPLAAGVGAWLLGVGLLFPVLTGPVLNLLSRPIGRAGPIGALARQQALASPRRIGATAASLVVTVALVTLLLVFNASLGASVPEALAARQHAEFSLASSAPPGLQAAVAEVAASAGRVPGVAAAATVTYVDVRVRDPRSDDARPRGGAAQAVDPTRVGDVLDVSATDGDLHALSDGEVAVRDRIAADHGWAVGDRLTVELPDASRQELVIAALFEGAITTDWLLSPATVEGHVPAPYQIAFVRLADGADQAVVRDRLEALVADTPTLELVDRDEQAAQMAQDNEGSLGILTALFALSLVVGGLGIANTLTLAIHERLRELGLLRAVGATRRQVRRLVRFEAVLTTVLGAGVGLALGLLGGVVALRALPGTGPAFTVPVVHLGLVLLGTVVLGLAASAIPARRAARVDVLDAVAAT